jgi:hypothetical protein
MRLRSFVERVTGSPEGTIWTNVALVQLNNVDALAGRRAGAAAPVTGAWVARLFVVSGNGGRPMSGTDEPAGRPVRVSNSGQR